MKKLLEKGQGFEIHLDPETPAILNVFTGDLQSTEEFRFHIEQIIKWYGSCKAEYPNLGYISDNVRMNALSPENIDWANEYFTPAVMGLGLKGMAFVVPQDVFASINVDVFATEANTKHQFYTRMFTTIEEAQSFVKNNQV